MVIALQFTKRAKKQLVKHNNHFYRIWSSHEETKLSRGEREREIHTHTHNTPYTIGNNLAACKWGMHFCTFMAEACMHCWMYSLKYIYWSKGQTMLFSMLTI
jgi:hypothetical protein